MLRVFIGVDHRQLISFNVLQQSIWRNSSVPVAITPLVINKDNPPHFSKNSITTDQLPIQNQGLTPFTFSRFMVPWLCNYQGWALFLDSDMLVLGDVAELFKLTTPEYSVMVVKHPKHEFEWASMMLFNCEKCKVLTPEYVDKLKTTKLIWAAPEEVGALPSEWNHLVGYDKPRDNPKLIHYTQGNPCFPETDDCEHADIWVDEFKLMISAAPWLELMGTSVHAARDVQKDGSIKIVPKYKLEGL